MAIVSMTFVLHCHAKWRSGPIPTKGPGDFNQLREEEQPPSVRG